MPLDQGVVDAVALSDFKTVSEMSVVDTVDHRRRTQIIAESALGQVLNGINMSGTSVPEGLGLQTAAASQQSGLPAQVAALAAAVATLQAMVPAAK